MIDPRHLLIGLITLVALAHAAAAQTTAPTTRPAPVGKATALIVVGTPGSPMYERHYRDRSSRFVSVLRAAGLEADRINVLSSDAGPLKAESVARALQQIGPTLKADEQFILVLMGHGAVADNSVTLMLTGPDLQMKAVAAELNGLKCRSQVVLNFCASAGDAMPLLAAPGRINIAGAAPGQVNDNDFAEFLLQELETSSPTLLLEAYNRATERFAQWLVRQRRAPGEDQRGWIVEGRESAAIFRKLYDAADVPPERRFVASAESEKPDAANPPLMPDVSPAWMSRRLVTETPAIDDAGTGAPASALTGKGFSAVVPTNEAPTGRVAAKTVLGRAN